jgi:hypothetical protein
MLLIRKQFLKEVLICSGQHGWYNILMDDQLKPCQTVRPIWLGSCSLEDAITRSKQSDKTLGIARKTQKQNATDLITFAVRVDAADVHTLRPLLSLNKQGADFISSRLKFVIGPLPLGLEDAQVLQVVSNIQWKCRYLVPMPKQPQFYILASETPPPVTTIPYATHDIHIKPLPDRWTREQNRPRSIEPLRVNSGPRSSQDRVAALEDLMQKTLSQTHSAVQEIKAEAVTFRTEQQKINCHFQTCIQTLNTRQEMIGTEIQTTKDFFKQQLDAFCHTIVGRIDEQQRAFQAAPQDSGTKRGAAHLNEDIA